MVTNRCKRCGVALREFTTNEMAYCKNCSPEQVKLFQTKVINNLNQLDIPIVLSDGGQ